MIKKYFEENGLKINLNKSKIVIFQRGGKHSAKEKWFWGDETIQVVNNYKYLGTYFSSTGNFQLHTAQAIKKSYLALNKINPLLHKTNIPTLKYRCKIFDSMVKNVLLYASPVWSFGNEVEIEKVQSMFLRRTLHLNPLTPSYILRLETGRLPLEFNSFKNTLSFWLRLISLNDNRIVKQAYLSLKDLKSGSQENNWCEKLKSKLNSLGFSSIWENQDPDLIKDNIPNILEAFITNSIQKDFASVENSNRYSFYKLYKSSFRPEIHLNESNFPLHIIRVFAQIRVNIDTIRTKNSILRFQTP